MVFVCGIGMLFGFCVVVRVVCVMSESGYIVYVLAMILEKGGLCDRGYEVCGIDVEI